MYKRQGLNCTGLCALPDTSDLTQAKSEFALLHYKEVVPWIQNQPECLSEQQILTAFEKVSKK